MNLQQHAGIKLGAFKFTRQAHHGAFDNVGGPALNGRVDGGAFGQAAHHGIFIVDARNMAFAAKQSGDEALLRRFFGGVHIGANTRELFKIGVDVFARLGAGNVQLTRQTKGRNAVNNAEVNGLGAAAHHGVHALQGHAEHFRRGHGMNVQPGVERVFQRTYVGNVGQQTQFDL